jgi:hypothetical protein
MPNDHRDPHEIEREIERERAELGASVEELKNRLSPEYFINELSRNAREHSGEIADAVMRSVKQNPVGLAVTGVGLAWLIFGRSYSDKMRVSHHSSSHDRYGRSDLDTRTDLVDHGGRPITGASDANRYAGGSATGLGGRTTSYDRPDMSRRTTGGLQERNYPQWAVDYDAEKRKALSSHDTSGGASGTGGGGLSDKVGSAGRAASDKVGQAAHGVSSGAKGAASGVSSGASSAASGVAGAARSAGGYVSDSAAAASERAARMRERLAHGTEQMSASARERVIAARERAMDAYSQADESMRRNLRRGSQAAGDFFEEQPLVAGALAVAVGAALAAALPRTRYEDEYLGAYRDDLFDEAERIFHEERGKLERVANAAVDEAGNIAKEKRDQADGAAPGDKSAMDAATDEAKGAAKRVADAAQKEAKDQDLGKPKS